MTNGSNSNIIKHGKITTQVRHDQLHARRLLRTFNCTFCHFSIWRLKIPCFKQLSRMASELKYIPLYSWNRHANAWSKRLSDTIPTIVTGQCNWTIDNIILDKMDKQWLDYWQIHIGLLSELLDFSILPIKWFERFFFPSFCRISFARCICW